MGVGFERYFLRKLKKVKKSNGQVLAINEVGIRAFLCPDRDYLLFFATCFVISVMDFSFYVALSKTFSAFADLFSFKIAKLSLLVAVVSYIFACSFKWFECNNRFRDLKSD